MCCCHYLYYIAWNNNKKTKIKIKFSIYNINGARIHLLSTFVTRCMKKQKPETNLQLHKFERKKKLKLNEFPFWRKLIFFYTNLRLLPTRIEFTFRRPTTFHIHSSGKIFFSLFFFTIWRKPWLHLKRQPDWMVSGELQPLNFFYCQLFSFPSYYVACFGAKEEYPFWMYPLVNVIEWKCVIMIGYSNKCIVHRHGRIPDSSCQIEQRMGQTDKRENMYFPILIWFIKPAKNGNIPNFWDVFFLFASIHIQHSSTVNYICWGIGNQSVKKRLTQISDTQPTDVHQSVCIMYHIIQ